LRFAASWRQLSLAVVALMVKMVVKTTWSGLSHKQQLQIVHALKLAYIADLATIAQLHISIERIHNIYATVSLHRGRD
jgi:hypothetical protein